MKILSNYPGLEAEEQLVGSVVRPKDSKEGVSVRASKECEGAGLGLFVNRKYLRGEVITTYDGELRAVETARRDKALGGNDRWSLSTAHGVIQGVRVIPTVDESAFPVYKCVEDIEQAGDVGGGSFANHAAPQWANAKFGHANVRGKWAEVTRLLDRFFVVAIAVSAPRFDCLCPLLCLLLPADPPTCPSVSTACAPYRAFYCLPILQPAHIVHSQDIEAGEEVLIYYSASFHSEWQRHVESNTIAQLLAAKHLPSVPRPDDQRAIAGALQETDPTAPPAVGGPKVDDAPGYDIFACVKYRQAPDGSGVEYLLQWEDGTQDWRPEYQCDSPEPIGEFLARKWMGVSAKLAAMEASKAARDELGVVTGLFRGVRKHMH
jgi:hypothetical protein